MAENLWQGAENLTKDAELFKNVSFLVQATDTEQFFLWEKYRNDVRWEEISLGCWLTIGRIEGRPICVSISYAILNGKKIAFIECTSQVADYKMLEDWLQHHTFDSIRYDNNTQWAHTNAMNFHNCLSFVKGN